LIDLILFINTLLGDLEFIASNTLEALLVDVEKAQFLPWGVGIIDSLKKELPSYKKVADQYYLSLPARYKSAEEIVLVMVSSTSFERMFSLLNNSFDDQQQNCLNNYKEVALRLR
jgi:hypothetical protein